MTLDSEACYRALAARDTRFDGVFFVAISTTGIYCRPVCPARTAKRSSCHFYRYAAVAERDGYRACLRCRPELAPGSASVDAVSALARRATARIDAGCLNDGSVDDLAAELGVTGRHLRRALTAELGVSPVELAQTRRLALAKQLLHDTSLPLVEVAFASGFASVRRFNAAFRARFARSPSALRRDTRGSGDRDMITLRLDYRPPLAWEPLLGFLAARAIPGVEVVVDGEYRRTLRIGDHVGWVAVAPDPRRAALRARVSPTLGPALMAVVARLRSLFDLDAHPDAIAAQLGGDRTLRASLARLPGLRVPGAVDGVEIATRAVLGQQVSVAAARTLAGRLVTALGEPADGPDGLSHRFPRVDALARASESTLAGIGLPGARARTISALSSAIAQDGLRLDGSCADPEATIATMCALPGIGDWTAQYVAMRALRWPDAFPAGDLVLRKALGDVTTRVALERADAWRPWRAYAALHLWNTQPASYPAGVAR